MSMQEIKTNLEQALPGSQVMVEDLTGTADHFQVIVVSTTFEGLSPIERHRVVYQVLGNDVASGAIHALSIKTYTPVQWKEIVGN